MPLKKEKRRAEQRKKSNETPQLKRIIFDSRELLSVVWDRR